MSEAQVDEFMATLAHELRNPLAAIQSSLELLRAPQLSEEDISWARDLIERQVQQLKRLTDGLLDLSRVILGTIALNKERLEADALVERAVAAVRPLVDRLQHHLVVSSVAGRKWVEVDAARMEQVLVHLLTNAAKYTKAGGRIRVSSAQVGSQIQIAVKDTGVGIAAEMLSRVFEPFIQVDQALARGQGGVGIGLTLVKRLVEMHGGTVSVTSEGLGKGSEFTLTLPAAEKPRQEGTPATNSPAALPTSLSENRLGEGDSPDHSVTPVTDGALLRGLRKIGTVPGGSQIGPKRFLVVDDNEDAAMAFSMILKLAGHSVTVAHDGPSALELARVAPPQMALIDIGLPGMNGYELIRELRALNALKGTRYVAISGHGQEEDRRRSLEAGFDRHLVKPVSRNELLSVLAQLEVT